MINFICISCRNKHHDGCGGGSWCDCQHRPNAQVTESDTEEADRPVTIAT